MCHSHAIRFLTRFGVPALVVAGALCLIPGCGQKGLQDYRMDVHVTPASPGLGPATVTALLQDPDGQPVSSAAIHLEANMTHPGMVPVFVELNQTDPGRYVAPIRFTMAGDWYLAFRIVLKDDTHLEHQMGLNVAGTL